MPAAPVLKVVVTHRSAARTKYGAAGWTRIRRAVTQLAAADAARGVTTRFFALDSAADCRKVGASRLLDVTDAGAAKAVVDSIYAAWAPAYLLLLGGPELLPLHSLTNPLWTGDPQDDPDQAIRSDLPYACETPAGPSVSAYRGPTRVVGRLPDLLADRDPDVLVNLLRHAGSSVAAPAATVTPVFALSTRTWVASTRLTVSKLAGVVGPVLTCPPQDSSWTAQELAPTVHLVNCHGAEFDPRWYGEARAGQQDLPTAMEARLLAGRIPRGAVVAAECCYGVAHWPPVVAGGSPSIAATMLREGASGVFGSSNVSYGPVAANEYADVICQLFLSEVLAGASLGRAALTARQRFVQGQSFLDPTDLKTLAQFDLLGDPSLHPIAAASSLVAPHLSGEPAGDGAGGQQHRMPAGIRSRREVLAAVGRALEGSAATCGDTARRRSGLTRAQLAALLGTDLPAGIRIRTFDAGRPARAPDLSSARVRSSIGDPEQVAHVAYVPASDARGRSLVVVRSERGAPSEVRVVVAR